MRGWVRLLFWAVCLMVPLTSCSSLLVAPDQLDNTDYQQMQVKYDEYPVVVPKRAALLLDRIMVALQKAVDDENTIRMEKNRIPVEETMDLQRRGQQKNGRVYWRCYFNAVTCF